MAEAGSEGTVLLVDDEASFLKLASWRLSQQGRYNVLTAQDGQAGLAMVHAHHPDVILLDLMMPKMNGHEMLRRLKDDPKTSDIPVIMLSAVGDQREIATSLSLGAVCHLTKPYDADELFREIKLALARHREAHQQP